MSSSDRPGPTSPNGAEIASLVHDLTPKPRRLAKIVIMGIVVNLLAVILLVAAILTIEVQRTNGRRTQAEFNARQVKVNAQVARNEAETQRLDVVARRLAIRQAEVAKDVNVALCALINGLIRPGQTPAPNDARVRAAINCPRPKAKPRPSPTP